METRPKDDNMVKADIEIGGGEVGCSTPLPASWVLRVMVAFEIKLLK